MTIGFHDPAVGVPRAASQKSGAVSSERRNISAIIRVTDSEEARCRRRRANHGRRLSHEDHVEIQRRVSEGETFASAAAAVGCSTKSIQRFMARTGGMLPRSRARSPLRLSLADREELSRGLMAGESLRQIAARLGRAASTISREVAWNGHRDTYRAWRAEKTAARRARRPKREKLATHPRLCCEVERRLRECWSPQQIAARLVCDYPDDLKMRVSHETIYRSLFVQARGALRKELTACLRTGRTQRRSHKRSEHSGTGRLRDMVLISDRPAGAADRAVPGHWEGDLMVGKGGRSAIGTLVERSSRYVVLPALAPRPDRRTRAPGAHPPAVQAPDGTSPDAHLGPGERDGRACAVHRRHQDRRLLLRPPQSLAAWQQ